MKVSRAAYTCEVIRNLAECSMTAFAQSETVGMAVKDRFIDSFQNHSDNFLQELVTERRGYPGGADDQERSRPDVKAQGGCGAPVRDNQVVRRSALLLVQGKGKGER